MRYAQCDKSIHLFEVLVIIQKNSKTSIGVTGVV